MRRLALLHLLAAPLSAKPRSGVPSTDFDGKPSGSRFIGFGEQGAAAFGGPASPLWNPAGLIDVGQTLLSMDFDVARHSKIKDEVLTGGLPLRGRKLSYLGFAAPKAAFFYRPLAHFNERTPTDVSDPANNFTEENLTISQFGFSAANETQPGAVLGLSLTYLNAHRSLVRATTGQPPLVEFTSGNGFTLDLGLRRKWENASFGASFLNLPGILYWNNYKADQLPIIMRLGGSLYPVPSFGFLAEQEKRFYRDGLPRPGILHLGMELLAAPWFQLRAGTFGEDLSDPDKVAYTGGFSAASARGAQVDFALRSYRFQKERVYNYFLSIILPFPSEDGRQEPVPARRFPRPSR